MNKWRQIANLREKPLHEVKDWDWIQLRMSSSPVHHWVGCSGYGSMCMGSKCGGRNGAFCNDELLKIVNNIGGAIKACDRIGLR